MKRILMFIDTIGFHGGAERQFAGLACMLKDRGYDVEVLAYYPAEGYKGMLEAHNVKVHIKNFGRGKLSKIKGAWHQINRINPDVVISYKNGPNFIACVLKMLGAKWHLIVSDRNTVQSINRNVRLQYWLYRFADVIVPNSNSQGRWIDKNFPNLYNKVKVITNFTDTELFHPVKKYASEGKRRIIVVGRLTSQKNVLRFIEAIGKLRREIGNSFDVDWYGKRVEDDYYSLVNNKISEEGVGDVFSIMTPTPQIYNIYPQYDFLCLPSEYEGFPNVICEGMSCGLPVVASRVCDNGDIVSEEVDGMLFNPASVEDMCATLRRMIEIPGEKLLEMGNNARNKSVVMLSAESFVNKYISVL